MKRIPTLLMAGLFVMALCAADALGCPNCKDSLAQNDPGATGLVQGYFWSILFMLSMPFTIFAGMSAYFYLLVRRARTAAPVVVAASGNPFRPVPAEADASVVA